MNELTAGDWERLQAGKVEMSRERKDGGTGETKEVIRLCNGASAGGHHNQKPHGGAATKINGLIDSVDSMVKVKRNCD